MDHIWFFIFTQVYEKKRPYCQQDLVNVLLLSTRSRECQQNRTMRLNKITVSQINVTISDQIVGCIPVHDLIIHIYSAAFS